MAAAIVLCVAPLVLLITRPGPDKERNGGICLASALLLWKAGRGYDVLHHRSGRDRAWNTHHGLQNAAECFPAEVIVVDRHCGLHQKLLPTPSGR